MKNKFSKKEAISYGWKTTKENFKFLALTFILFVVSTTLPGILADSFKNNNGAFFAFLTNLAGWVLELTVSLGIIFIGLKIYENKKTYYKDLYAKINLFIPYLFGSIIYSVIVIAGFLLLIIPGIIWSLKFQYFSYAMVDKNLGPIDALKESSRITKKVKINLLLFNILLILINILGMLALGIGLLLTVPTTLLANVYVYKHLSEHNKN